MIIKRIVTISLFLSLGIMVVLLLVGLFVPTKTLEQFNRSKTATKTVVAVDKDGNQIAGASVQVNEDGTTQVVDANGNTVAGASAAAKPTSAATAVSATSSGSAGTTTGTGGTSGGTTGGGGGTMPAPTISSFVAASTSIAYNASTNLSWASANASTCSMSPGSSVATSGSKSTGALTSTTTFTLTCIGSGSVSKQVTVSVGAAPVACGSPGGSCTSAQVAAHNTKTNCWVIYSGSYYIITNYVNSHNGGSGAFTSSTCGHDIAAYLNGSTNSGTSVSRHNHSGAAYNTLNSYKVGPVN